MQTRSFIKEKNIWYINLNIGDGDVIQKISFRKVADVALEMLAEGKERLLISFDTKPFEGAEMLELLRLHPMEEGGGGYYYLKHYKRRQVNQELVLNAAIEYVFGKIPDRIYLKKLE